jgi:hypothetical protein
VWDGELGIPVSSQTVLVLVPVLVLLVPVLVVVKVLVVPRARKE